MSDDFNVVRHALQEHRDKLWNMTQQNMDHGSFNVMDQLRLQQIETLDDAIADLASVERAARAAEREACALVCEETTAAWTQPVYNSACMDCATAIRNRDAARDALREALED